MSWFSKCTYSVKSLFQKRKLDAQLTEEIRTHVDMATEANVAAGMPPEEARFAALREFGNVAGARERTREERGWVWLEQLAKDFRFALRSLGRARELSLTVIVTLVLGISLAIAIVSLTYPVLFRTPSYPEPDRLVAIGIKNKTGGFQPGCSGAELTAFREQTNVFSEIAAMEGSTLNVVVEGRPETAGMMGISVDCFHVLGIKPAMGRIFLPEDFQGDGANVLVVTDLFWREKLQAASDVIGRQLRVDEQTYTIVGVLSKNQDFPEGLWGQLYRPIVIRTDPKDPYASYFGAVIGRLNQGVSREQASAALTSVKLSGLPEWAETDFASRRPVLSTAISQPTEPYWMMYFAGLVILASAVLNAMNMMMARLLGRQRELAIRLALGGSRWQIARLLLIESMVLSISAGLLVAYGWYWLGGPIYHLLSGGFVTVGKMDEWWREGWNYLPRALGYSMIAGVLVALVPVWRVLRTGLNVAIRESGPGYGESSRLVRLRSGLVMLQAAFAVILLIGTGLMVRSFDKIHQVDLGYDPVGKVKVAFNFPKDFDPTPEARLQLFEKLAERLATLPGVKDVAYGQDAMLSGEWVGEQVKLSDGTMALVTGYHESVNFPQVLGLRLAKGRWFSPRSGGSSNLVEIVINETMARQIFGDRDPIGQSITSKSWVVVGVVHDINGAMRLPVGPHYFAPIWTIPQNGRSFVLRLEQDPSEGFAGLVQRAIYEVEPRLVVYNNDSVGKYRDNMMWTERSVYMVLRGMTPISIGLAAIGLFAVLGYNVDARKKEFGVRLALGATPGDLRRLVLRRSLTTVALGAGVGMGAALALTRLIQSLLFETTPYDPIVYVAVTLLLLAVAALAAYLPARRAAKVDPVVALRAE